MEKFKLFIKKEILLYLLILVLLALVSHTDLLSNPFARFEMMGEKGNYFHPFFYAFVLYSLILIVRKTIDLIIALFQR